MLSGYVGKVDSTHLIVDAWSYASLASDPIRTLLDRQFGLSLVTPLASPGRSIIWVLGPRLSRVAGLGRREIQGTSTSGYHRQADKTVEGHTAARVAFSVVEAGFCTR